MISYLARKEKLGINDLLEIMSLLRSPDGCPWDREQTHKSIRSNFIEEVYEACEGIDKGNSDMLLEELGDVLLQVVFHTEIEREKGAFSFTDVTDRVCRKLILRHPHIFSDTVAETSDEVLKNWDEIKKDEKGHASLSDELDGVAVSLPALMRAEKLAGRVKKAGKAPGEYIGGVHSSRFPGLELTSDIASDTDERGVSKSLGDALLYTAVVANRAGCDPEASLMDACERFIEEAVRDNR